MLRLKPRQREFLADKLLDGVNLVGGAFVAAYFLGEPRGSARLLLGGIALWIAALVVAIGLTRNRR